ncbi:unnamed protein product [Closterium sp. NIES-64]|nr:unnamed protein product [Closterium sp. NIES-64]
MEKRAKLHDSESCDAIKSFRKARWQQFQQNAVDKFYSVTWGLAVLVFTSVPGTTCLIGALLLPSNAVLALLAVWLVIESVFFVFRSKQLKQISDEYVELPLPSREETSTLLDRVLAVAKQADYNDFVGGWFMGASLASLTRTNVRQFISHGFFHRFYNELSSEYQEAVEEFVDRAEVHLEMHFKDPNAPPPPPPDLLGHIVGFLTAAAMRLLGFSKHTAPNGIHYWFRAPKKSAPKRKTHKAAAVMPIFDDTSAAGATSAASTAPLLGARGGRVTREEEAEEGVVLVHGLGLGLTPYLSFVHMLSRSFSIKKLIVVELAHLAVRLSTSSPTIDDVADGLTDAMAVHGMQSAIFVGHSYGALVLARQVRKRPETVSAMGFVDPACFLLCLPKVLFNFIYKVPGSPSIGDTMAEAVRWFLCGRELQVARALCRGFNWHAYQVWADDIPVHRSVVMLAGQDQIVPSEHIRNYLANTPVDVMYNDGYHHAQILFSDGKQREFITRLKAACR